MPAEQSAPWTPLYDSRWIRAAPWLIVLIFLLFGVAWSLVVPPFETPDEPYHYAFARHLAQGNPLPVQSAEGSGPWEQEGSQAPLYYMLAGVLTQSIPQDDFAALAVRNERANIGDPLYPGNKNFMLYSGSVHPLVGANLALHIGRWLSLALGVVTLLCTWGLAALFFRPNRLLPLLAMALVAAIPQFQFLSASFSNDSLVTAVSAMTLLWLGGLLAKPAESPIRWWHWLVLGVLLGVAALTKLQALGLFLLAAAVGVGIMVQRRDWMLPLRAILPVALPALAIAGWWYGRNLTLYGDWTGLTHLLDLNGRRTGSLDLADFWLEFRGLRYSFWGLFGWFNLLLPNWLYLLLDLLSVMALGASLLLLIWRWLRPASVRVQGATRVLTMSWGWLLLTFALLVYWTLQATGSQGRLLFPAISTLGALFVFGLDGVTNRLPAAVRWGTWGALLALLVGTNLYVLAWMLPAAYRQPAPVAAMSTPALAVRVLPTDLTFGESGITLRGIDLPDARFSPGDDVPVTLYLTSATPILQDYQIFLQLLDETGVEIANITSHPGWGRNPTTLWQPGALYADHYLLRITGDPGNASPLVARLYTGVIDPATADSGNLPLETTNRAGEVVTPFVGTVVVLPHTPPASAGENAEAVGATFGDVIRIDSVRVDSVHIASSTDSPAAQLAPGAPLTATLLYEATGTPATEYTGYVQLLNAEGAPVAGFDQQPAANRFPTTLWRSGDRILTTYPLTLPADLPSGEYRLITGFYESASQGAQRLPVTDANNRDAGDGQILLATFALP